MKRHWFEVLTPKQMIHWVPASIRAGSFYHDAFPDLPIDKHEMPKRVWNKRKSRRKTTKLSRRRNR